MIQHITLGNKHFNHTQPLPFLGNLYFIIRNRKTVKGIRTTNKRAAEIAIEATDEVAMKRQQIDNINQIHIKIIRCCDIQSRRRGMRIYHTI
jgi:hypothetical protein